MHIISTTKRIIALTNNNLITGFYVVTPNKHIHPIFQPQCCTLTNPDTRAKLEYLIGHGSNDSRFLHAEYAPVKVAGTFVCLVDTTSTKVPACYHSGAAFTAANLTGTHTLDLQEGITSHPIWDPRLSQNTVTKSTLEILDTTVVGGAFGVCCILMPMTRPATMSSSAAQPMESARWATASFFPA